MIYRVRHRTAYHFERASDYARCLFRLQPQDGARQSLLRHRLTTQPAAARRITRPGAFEETTLTAIIATPHRVLAVEADSLVDMHSPPIAPGDGPAWEAVRDAAFAAASLDARSPAHVLYPSARAPIADPITDYARQSFSPGRPILAATGDLMRRMYADFAFDPGATVVSTPAMEAFAARRGVCQDFAHIMICALRGLGLPAAYVSGYVRTRPLDGRPVLTGSDAGHAWVDVWCGEDRGWIGFDPTNDAHAQDDHVVVAVGRDYADCAPVTGILLSPGEQTLEVEVDVIPLPWRSADRGAA